MKKVMMTAGTALCLLFPVLLGGQETGLLRLDKKQGASSGSEVALVGGVEEGRFRPVSDPHFQWSAGAEAQFVRHGVRSSWFGTISLEQMMGKYNRSSLFLEPGYFPMDLLDSSAGTGSRQTGRIEFGWLGDVGDLWEVGFRTSAKLANDLKKTAFRHSSLGTDLELQPFVTFVSDDDTRVVTSYQVRLRTEKGKPSAPDSDWSALAPVFFDKGMAYGAYDPTLCAFPVLEFSHGFDGEYRSPGMSLGFDIIWKRGRAGEKDYSRFRFPGSTIGGYFEILREGFEVDRTYRIAYRRMRDQFREAASSGFEAVSDRAGRNLKITAGLQPHEGILKRLALDLDGNHWTERAVASPVWDRTQRMDGSATLLATLSKGAVDLDASLMGGMGGWLDRGRTAEDAVGDVPVRFGEHWLRKTEYFLAPRMGMGGTVTWRIPAVKGLFLQFHGYWIRAFNVSYLGGKNRETVTLKIGYNY